MKDRLFLATFVSTLAILVFFLGSSIIGYVFYSSSLYCEGGLCKGFCHYDEDCFGGEVCCSKLDFGVCTPAAECELSLEMANGGDEKMPGIETPAGGSSNHAAIFSVLILAAMILGAIHFSRKG
jgi:hypothetical protein